MRAMGAALAGQRRTATCGAGEDAGRKERTMEPMTLLLGGILMLLTPIGILFYVALAVAIPVCHLLDWLDS